MPELPEVETIRRQLAPAPGGADARSGGDPRSAAGPGPSRPRRSRAGCAGARGRARAAGTASTWCGSCSGELYLIMHLRMTGALLFDPAVEPAHTRVRFELDGGDRLVYVDPRRFGTGHLAQGAAERDRYLAERIGIEPMTPEFTLEHLRAMARGRQAPIKSFVLDQRRIAGVGNIYADEALFRARIHPLRATGTLSGAAAGGASGRDRGRAPGRDRGQGRDDRRLPPRRRRPRLVSGPVPRPPARGRAVPAVRDHDPQAGGRRAGDLRVRALPAQAAAPARRPQQLRIRCGLRVQSLAARSRRPARSAASSWSKPPIDSPSITICGNVTMPVRSASLARPSGSFARLISS